MLKLAGALGTYFDVVLWSAIEPNVSVMSACLPSYPPIFKLCIRSIVTLKASTLSTRSARSQEKITTERHDFVRLVGSDAVFAAQHEIPLQNLGVHTEIGGDQTTERIVSEIPRGTVHVRSEVKVQEI